MIRGRFAVLLVILLPMQLVAVQDQENMRVALVLNPYTGDRASPETSAGPEIVARGGIQDLLRKMGTRVALYPPVALSADEEREYGQWNRFGLANGHLGELVAAKLKEGYFPVGLLANCSSVAGMLAGLQHARGRRPLKVGLVFIDAHGDFNTPETTLSGMLGGMPVAVAAGHCLTRMRLQSGLDPALPEKYIVLSCVRDTDPLEQERIDNSLVELLPVTDIKGLSQNIHRQMQRLSQLTDLIYVHIDMDVLEPREVSGHPLTVPDGPTSLELGAALRVMFSYPKAAALGIASYPHGNDPGGLSMKAIHNLVEGAVKGVMEREKE